MKLLIILFIIKLEIYIQVAHLEYLGRKRQYFQLQFVETEVTDVLIDRNIRFVPSQRDVRNNGVNQNKYTATIEHEKMGRQYKIKQSPMIKMLTMTLWK